jgi:hypothetical protein
METRQLAKMKGKEMTKRYAPKNPRDDFQEQ